VSAAIAIRALNQTNRSTLVAVRPLPSTRVSLLSAVGIRDP
jgi:hypothetical protein